MKVRYVVNHVIYYTTWKQVILYIHVISCQCEYGLEMHILSASRPRHEESSWVVFYRYLSVSMQVG